MKILIICLVVVCGIVGISVKNKYISQANYLRWLKTFLEYTLVNISLYKNNLSQIIESYLIMQKNKNANYDKNFAKINNLYEFDENFIKEKIIHDEWFLEVNTYICNFGKSDLNHECEKTKRIIGCIDDYIISAEKDIKQKGDLYFKLWLAVGIVLGIVLW